MENKSKIIKDIKIKINCVQMTGIDLEVMFRVLLIFFFFFAKGYISCQMQSAEVVVCWNPKFPNDPPPFLHYNMFTSG